MSRWIDADAVKSIIRSGVSTDTEADQDYVCERIDEVPSIDIVRCGECKYCDVGIDEDGNKFWKCLGIHYGGVNPDDFCSYGERGGE